jgi:hypothetical protein
MYCFFSTSKFSLLPNLTLHFEDGAQMRVGPENYLLRKGASSKGVRFDATFIKFLLDCISA